MSHQLEIKANRRGRRREKPLNTLVTQPGFLRRKDDKEMDWVGVGVGRGNIRKYKGKKEGNCRKQLHPLEASKKATLCLRAFRETTGGRGGDSCTQVLAVLTGTSCQLEGKQAVLDAEGRDLVRFFFSLKSWRKQSPAL